MKTFCRLSEFLNNIFTSKWKDIIFSLGFGFGSLVIWGLYYLGFAYTENVVRSYMYPIIRILFAILSGLFLITVLKRKKMSFSSWISLGILLVFYVVSFTRGFLKFGFHANVTDYAAHFISCALPMLFVGICGALLHSEQTFFKTLELISFFVFPGALIYFNTLIFNCNPFSHHRFLGIIGYIQVAVTIMPFLLAHIIQFSDKEPFEIPIFHKKAAHPQLLRCIFIAVYWIAIIGSGSRSIYVCIAGFCILFVISKIIHKESIKRILSLSFTMAIILIFNIFIYAPPGMSYGVQRMQEVIDGFKQGNLVTSRTETSMTQDVFEELVTADSNEQVANQPTHDSSKDPQNEAKPSEEPIRISNRTTIYKLAWAEFLKSPIFGMGCGGFKDKYGLNPHSIILELICETGIIGCVPMFTLICFAIYKLLRIGWVNPKVRYILLFLMAFALKENMDGNVWKHEPFLWAIGYGLAIQIPCAQTGILLSANRQSNEET